MTTKVIRGVTRCEWHTDALARIANTFGVVGDQELGVALREFANAALVCQTQEEYDQLLRSRP